MNKIFYYHASNFIKDFQERISLTKIQEKVVQHVIADGIIVGHDPVQVRHMHQSLAEACQFRQLFPSRVCGSDKVNNRHIR